jgi:hypothetical protein
MFDAVDVNVLVVSRTVVQNHQNHQGTIIRHGNIAPWT